MASALATLLIATRRLATYFIRLPLPNGAEVAGRAREAGEQRLELADRLAVAAGIDDEIAGPRLRAGAAHRAVEHDVAGLAQRALGLLLVGEREGAGFDDHLRRHARGRDRRDGGVERRRLRQAGDDGRDLGGERRHVGRDLDPGARQRAAARRIDVVADDTPAGIDQVARERSAHDAEADHADRLRLLLAIPCSLRPSVERTLYGGSASRSSRMSAPSPCRLSPARAIPYGSARLSDDTTAQGRCA